MDLNKRLLLLVGSAVVPLMVSMLGFDAITYDRDVEQEIGKAEALTRSLSRLVECELEIRVSALQALAASPSLRSGELARFRGVANTFLEAQMPHSAIILLREDGQQVLNTELPPDAALPKRTDLSSIRQAMATGKPAVSNLFQRDGEWIIAIDIPVMDAGRAIYVLSLNPRLVMFEDVLKDQRLPQDWVVSIFDRVGVNIARIPSASLYRGHQASATLIGPMLGSPDGIQPTISLEGIPLVTAWQRDRQFGWYVALGIPRADLSRPAWQSALVTLLMGLGISGLSVMLALHVGRQIVKPMDQLRRLATAPDGEWLPTRLSEVNEVATALIEAENQRKAREVRMRELQAELIHAARLSTIGQMAAAISHELMQPLTAAQNYAGVLTRLTAGQHNEIAQAIRDQLKRAGDVVRRIRDLSARRPAKLVPDAINEVVDEAVRLSMIGMPRGSGDVRLSLAEGLPPVALDRVMVEQCVINLVRNALDAMADSEVRRATVSTRLVEGHVEICVADTGPGFAQEVTDHLFQPFVTTKANGLGLGLSICRDLIHAHNGAIKIENGEHGGATVRIFLPI